jgi:S1-C subfamily serine protease
LKTINQKLKNLISTVEKSTSPNVKIGVAALLGITLVSLSYIALKDKSDITSSTVMITSLAGGGGSGVVVDSKPSESLILTNHHICKSLKNGGVVTTNQNKQHTVVSYKLSKVHDLCLISVAAQLPGKVTIASKAPTMYEQATVSGHPNLMPNVVTTGHFSGHQIINVFTGVRKCTLEESRDRDLGIICFFFGGMPVIKTYEAVLVTATIMPGSSGSAVYNNSKELSAVVFAGSGELGYAYSVPFQYVYNFLNKEVNNSLAISPNYTLDIRKILRGRSSTRSYNMLVQKCLKEVESLENNHVKTKIEETCKLVIRDANWRF